MNCQLQQSGIRTAIANVNLHVSLLYPGTVIDGQFEILAPLGEGGMGQIYRARRVDLDRTVAIKVLFPTLVSDRHANLCLQRLNADVDLRKKMNELH